MLPNVDPDGRRTATQSVSHALGLLTVSLCPFLFRLAGAWYLLGAVVLGSFFLWCAIRFARELSLTRARQLFFASIVYLPLLLVLLVVDKVK
jgi:heme O synthase-like polyprenyltransferase